jgi:hypothetical protein
MIKKIKVFLIFLFNISWACTNIRQLSYFGHLSYQIFFIIDFLEIGNNVHYTKMSLVMIIFFKHFWIQIFWTFGKFFLSYYQKPNMRLFVFHLTCQYFFRLTFRQHFASHLSTSQQHHLSTSFINIVFSLFG